MEQLEFTERVMFSLRSLYNRHGYTQYKMSKFEEYDLYARNKDFLISDSVITFTDLGGKLMALKPDVTLSIVKNTRDDVLGVQKLYYNENVYRVSRGDHGFKEIMQVGLEALGNVDDYCICEVLSLAAESLRSISPECILEVSHMGILSDVLDSIGIPREKKGLLFRLIGQKNLHELERACQESGVATEGIALLKQLVSACGAPETVLPAIREALAGKMPLDALEHLQEIVDAMDQDLRQLLRFDFSVVDDIHYYNGIVFKGFIHGLPRSVLSGGQYDNLMRKMKRKASAIGFAVYTDLLQRLDGERKAYDVDVVLLYDGDTPLKAVRTAAAKLTGAGNSVLVQQARPEGIRYEKLMKLAGSEVRLLENNA